MANNLVVQLLLKTGSFSTDLKQAKGQVQNFQKGCQSAGNAVTSFTRGLGLNIGSLGKLSLAAGAAAAAGKVLKDSFKSNTDAMDAFNREMETVKASYRALTSQLFGKGKMSIDLSGISQQAREYYDAMDSANVANVAITNELKLQQVEYDSLLATAMNVSLTEVDRLDALNKASEVMQNQLTLKRQMAQLDKTVAKESLENKLVSSGVNKYWLETQGQDMLKELLGFDTKNSQYMFDTFYKSVNPAKANTGIFGHRGIYDQAVELLATPAFRDEILKRSKEAGFDDINEYLKDLKKQQDEATEAINSTKYKLAEALHNLRGSAEGYEVISKYILLYLNDMGTKTIDAETKNMEAMIERLRKRITGRDGKTINYKDGSIGKLEEKIRKKRSEWEQAVTQEARDILKKEIDAMEATLTVMKGGTLQNTNLTEGSIDWLADQVKIKTEELNKLALGLTETGTILQKMNDWGGSWEDFVNSLSDEEKELFQKFADVMKQRWDLLNEISGYQIVLSSAQGNKTPTKPSTKNYTEGSYGYQRQELVKKIDAKKEEIYSGTNLSTEDIKKKIEELKALSKELSQLDASFGFGSTKIQETTSTWDNFNKAMANTATIVSSLTDTFKENSEVTAASVLQMVATALPAIGSLISAIGALTTVEAVEAGVGAVSKAVSTSKHWIEAIAAVASLGAVVAAAIAAARKPMQESHFATGGIVPGQSFTGDRVSAMVNSGEMVLTKAQQARLFRMANGEGVNGGNNVTFHISGSDLVGVLDNNIRKQRLIR